MQEQAQAIVKARDRMVRIPYYDRPAPGEYVITGLQAGNIHGQRGWHLYIGYVVQIRLKAGAFGSDLFILRHPDGTLMQHSNQDFSRPDESLLEEVLALFPEGMTPEAYEDYEVEYTLGAGQFPAKGKIIEPSECMPPVDDTPLMSIRMSDGQGNVSVTVI